MLCASIMGVSLTPRINFQYWAADGWADRQTGPSYNGPHAPHVKVLLGHGVFRRLVVVPPLGARWRRLCLPHNAGDFCRCLHKHANIEQAGCRPRRAGIIAPSNPDSKPRLCLEQPQNFRKCVADGKQAPQQVKGAAIFLPR